ncbi:hypothetical protein HJG60_008938 [Phyllostomus discolor]|uniref:Uncharacterized protein n=1 Tax=Phyllostomus discolor TaxID=89673 RepID=A0A833YWT7_9CHIR|nr:hypothetical protein HJG60_008938 [Phyllostomus discolor]
MGGCWWGRDVCLGTAFSEHRSRDEREGGTFQTLSTQRHGQSYVHVTTQSPRHTCTHVCERRGRLAGDARLDHKRGSQTRSAPCRAELSPRSGFRSLRQSSHCWGREALPGAQPGESVLKIKNGRTHYADEHVGK